jgi:hypothetical protein
MGRHKHNTRLSASRIKHPLTIDQKRRIVYMYQQESIGPTKITDRMKAAYEIVSLKTVEKFLARFKKTGKLEAVGHGGRRETQSTSMDVEKKICELVDNDNELTAYLIQFALDDCFGSDPNFNTPSTKTIYKILHKNNFTRKLLKNRPAAYNSDSTKQMRFRYVHDVAKPVLTADNSIFIDETPFASHQHRTQGWSRKGVPAFRSTSTARGNNHSVIAAISPVHGLVHYIIKKTEEEEQYQTKGVGEEVFRDFTKELLSKPIFKSRSSFYFCVMDNVNFHKCETIKKLYNKKHHHVLLPPYSPFLNPIEYMFSRWKSLYKNLKHRNDGEVVESIQQSAEKLNEKKVSFMNCYKHTTTYYERVLNFETIDD